MSQKIVTQARIAGQAAQFVRTHMDSFFPGTGDAVLSVKATDCRKWFVHSGVRPAAAVTVVFRNRRGKPYRRRIWAKRVGNVRPVLDHWRDVYEALAAAGLEASCPTPYGCDDETGVLFSSRANGGNLTWRTLCAAATGAGPLPVALTALYQDIGQWLRRFHVTLATPESRSMAEGFQSLTTALTREPHFQRNEKRNLLQVLETLAADPLLRTHAMRLTRPHNDFCLRNILTDGGRFTVIDWDAMLHPAFPRAAPIWNDITVFVLNVESILRFHPFVSAAKTAALTQAFLKGYFAQPGLDAFAPVPELLWIHALYCYIGGIGDRPLYEIYNHRLSERFARRLKRKLLAGPQAFAGTYERT